MKECPLCKTSIIHYRGHGDHKIVCKKCLTWFCYLCSYVFKEHGSRSSSDTSTSSNYSAASSYKSNLTIIPSHVKHYKHSNCNNYCDEVCCCESCPICLILYKEHCGKCNSVHCERYNHSLQCVKLKYELDEENPSNITNTIVPT